MDRIIYPQHIVWHVDVSSTQDALLCFSKKIAKRIRRGITYLESAGYKFVIEPVDDTYIDLFFPLYKENILQKDNPHVFDVKTELQKRATEGFPIEAVSLYKGNTYLGGVIYRILDEQLTINYRTFLKEFDVKTPIGASMIADYFVYKKAIELHKSTVSHGRDRNLYGLHSGLGLPLFKLHAGAKPKIRPSKDLVFYSRISNDFVGNTVTITENTAPEAKTILEQNFHLAKEGVLVMLGTTPGEDIKKAILFVKEKNDEIMKKYSYLFENEHFSTDIIEIQP